MIFSYSFSAITAFGYNSLAFFSKPELSEQEFRLVPGAKPESLTVIEIGRNSSTLSLRLTSGVANSI
jgi:hypothetical protein